jgi:hypothetical protein
LSNRGFIAGYVRSYARYLDLDPRRIFERFCSESGFSSNNAELCLHKKKPAKTLPKYFGLESSWKPGDIGQNVNNSKWLQNFIKGSAPIFLVLIVLFGTSFGAFSVLKEVQKLDVVAFEESPDVFLEVPSELVNSSLLQYGTDIYSSEELALPVFEPRDQAVSMIKSSLSTALEDKKALAPFTYVNDWTEMPIAEKEKSIHISNFDNLELPDPVVRTVPKIPEVKLLAMTPAWVRIKDQAGDVIFEKILNPLETYTIEKDLFRGALRAGNAQNVYFLIDDKAFGPLSIDKSVVKNVSLDPTTIKSNLIMSSVVTESFWSEEREAVLIDTAEVID